MTDVSAKLQFLGWDESLLGAASDWLVAELGDALPQAVLVVPGASAQRRLLELLVDRLPGGEPPRIVTHGRLVDELVGPVGALAGRASRTLAWAAALASLPTERLQELVSSPPGAEDLPAWRALGAMARGLHGTLASADLDFEDVRQPAGRLGGGAEAQRWNVLGMARRAYLERLAGDGLLDPHEARRDAVREGRLDRSARVFLIGVVESTGLPRAALAQLEQQPTALVFAPESEAGRFDALGCVARPDDGAAPPAVPVDRARWSVEDRPADQADRVVRVLAAASPPCPASEVTVGLLDGAVGPPLIAQLAQHGVVGRDAAGTPVGHTAPARLVAAMASWLDGRSADALAALLRHPDIDSDSKARCLVTSFDTYRSVHLPRRATPPWLALGKGLDVATLEDRRQRFEIEAERDRRTLLSGAVDALDAQLGDLAGKERRALPEWVEAMRGWLLTIYGARELAIGASHGPAQEAARRTARALRELSSALDDLKDAQAWGRPVTAAAALHELHAALGGAAVPPSPDAEGIELLGWLELPLDDASRLVVTGVNDGKLPESIGSDRLLPEALARELGLPDDVSRLHRDAFLLTATLHSREVWLITGRKTDRGDPLRPSRLLFTCDDEELLERTRAWVGAANRRAAPQDGAPPQAPTRALPMAATASDVTRMSATAFGAYIRSPYQFYLDRVLHLNGVDDTVAELDPLAFGTLGHAVLEAFGRGDLRESANEDLIAEELVARLDALIPDHYGRNALPAVTIQLAQMRRRLRAFARAQAAWVREGWRILHVEAGPPEPVLLTLPDQGQVQLTGRIDRIDRHEDGRWAVLDYKTSEGAARPQSKHRRGGAWVDLQLPVYRELIRDLDPPEVVELGYVNLPAALDDDLAGFQLVPRVAKGRSKEAWDDDLHASAVEAMVAVASKVRAGEFTELGELAKGQVDDPLVRALAGLDLLDGVAPDVPDDEEAP